MSQTDDTTTSSSTDEPEVTTSTEPTTEEPTSEDGKPAKKATKKRATKKATAKKKSTAKKKATTKKKSTKADEAAGDDASTATDDAGANDADTDNSPENSEVTSDASTSKDDARAGDGDQSEDESGRVGRRTRTRVRTTTAADEGADARKADAKASKDDSSDEDDDEGGSRTRRRRGSRGGRGRGKAKGEDEQSSDSADDEAKEEAKDEAKDEAKEEPKGSRDSGRSKAKAGDQKAKDGDDSKSKADRETEKAIAKGGTRMAAKRRGRSGGGGAGGGGGGGHRRGGPQGVSEEERRAILAGPPRTMLVTHKGDRTQIVVMEDRRAVEHYVTHKDDVTYVGNIYMARVQNVLPGMEAAFLDIGKGRNGVLYAGEVLYDEQDLDDGEPPRIEDTLKPGQKVLVQVTKDPMGTKGPRLTQMLSLAGRYMVLAPNSDVFGISRKLTDKDRDRLRKIVKRVKPEHHGIIVRTAAENATDEALEADLKRLLAKWEKVEKAAEDAKPMTAVYEEPQLVVKVIRDNFGPEFERCIVDDPILYEEVREYLGEVAAELLDKVELYKPVVDDEDKPRSLYEGYNVAEQLRKATDRKVWLPSGGYLIIETTEAMKVIDVNTGKFTGSKDTSLEEVVLKTNLEAADEIVRQLRLRDMGGIIIVDFIDMLLKANQDQVIRRLKRELLRDRTKTRVSEVSRLGLVQMTRKNVSQGLVESFSHKCDKCNGIGRIVELPE